MRSRYSTCDDMFDIVRNFDSIFRDAFGEPRLADGTGAGRRLPASSMRGFTPAVEWFARDKQLVLRAELPGVDPAQVEVTLAGDQLFIRGEKKLQQEVDEPNHYVREIAHGRFERSFTLPEGVEGDQVSATFSNGILEVTMPAESAPASRKVPIEAGGGADRKQIKAA